MPSSAQLASIASSLDTYRTQFAALGNALSALRVVSDQMIAQLDRDREALASHLEAAADMISEINAETDAAEAGTATIASLDTAAVEAGSACGSAETDSEIRDTAELSAELATGDATAAVTEHAVDSELIATDENSADPVVEPVAPEADCLPVMEDANEAEIEIKTETETESVVSGVAARESTTEATTIVSTEPDIAAQGPDATNAGAALATAHDTPAYDADDKVVSLADRRKAKPDASPARRRAIAVVASILVTTTATMGLHELMQSDLGQRMLELGTCDGNMLSATRDCSLLSWLMI